MESERSAQLQHHGGEAEEVKADQVEVKDRGLFDGLLGRKKPEEHEKEKQKQNEEALVSGMEKVKVDEPEKDEAKKEKHEGGEKKESLLAKLHRSSSSSSSSSSDEEEEVIDENGEVVKRKKKSLKDKIKEKLPGHKEHDKEGEHKTDVPTPTPVPATHGHHQEGEHKPYVPVPASATVATHVQHHDNAVVIQKIEDDVKTEAPPTPAEEEKKGLLDKIKEKLPGHKKPEDAAATPAVHAPAPAPAPHSEDVSSPDGREKKGLLGKIMDKIPGYNKGTPEEEHKTSA